MLARLPILVLVGLVYCWSLENERGWKDGVVASGQGKLPLE